MKDLKAVKGHFYIHNLISEGEHEHQDFKFAISDAAKIAHSISAFANNDGGHLLVGVKDNGNVAGVRNEEDIYVVEQAAQMYCRPPQSVNVTAYKVDGGAVVFKVDIAKAPRRPVESRETDGTWRVYYRVKDENIVAHPLMVRCWRSHNSRSCPSLMVGEDELAVLDYIDTESHVSVADLCRRFGLSKESIERLMVKFYRLEVIKFTYINQEFRILRHRSPKND